MITRILVGSLQFFAWDFFHQQYHLGEIGCETKGSCCFFSFPTKNQKGTKLAGSKKSSDQEKMDAHAIDTEKMSHRFEGVTVPNHHTKGIYLKVPGILLGSRDELDQHYL